MSPIKTAANTHPVAPAEEGAVEPFEFGASYSAARAWRPFVVVQNRPVPGMPRVLRVPRGPTL
jgi:hypothetical protein